jgi:hypothetical protein
MNQKIFVGIVFLVILFTLGAFFKKSSQASEPCMNHADAEIFYIEPGHQKAVRAPHENHHGESMIYLCE